MPDRTTRFRLLDRCHPRLSAWLCGLLVCLVALVAVTACAPMQARNSQPPRVLVPNAAWAHEFADLKPSPDMIFGRLSNGMRYILKENRTPSDRVSMHLYIQAGSLCETEEEQGMAHFLEHMLFNGSTHFQPDELVKYFQRIGMQFGPDANAHTGFAETVYDVLLPKGDVQSLSEAMRVLRDYAEGALLLPEQIEKEKKVILSEKRARDSAQYRTMRAAFAFEMPGTLPARRFPIGTEQTLLNFDQASLRRFYDAWYHPRRMTLVMVGQFDPSQAQQLLQAHFAPMTPRASERPLPAFGAFAHRGINTFYHFEKEIGATSVRIETLVQQDQPQDSKAYQKQILTGALADRIVRNRLEMVLQDPHSGLTAADIGSAYFLRQIRYTEISAQCRAEHWEKVLGRIEQVLRQSLLHGFTPAELERVTQSYLSELQRDVKEEATRDSQEVARGIMHSLGDGEILQSAAQRLELLTPILETVTPEEVQRVFRRNWSASHRLVLVTGDVDLSASAAPAEEVIRQTYLRSARTPVKPPIQPAAVSFPYLPEPSGKAEIIRRDAITDLGVETVVFANGLQLNLKKTDFKANEVVAGLSFGQGKSTEPVDQAGLAELTEALINEAGFGAMSRTDREQALAGRLADITLDVREEMFLLGGEAVTQEIPLLFQLMRTFVLDPGYRPEAMEVVRKRFEQHYQALKHDIGGGFELEGQRFMSGGDSRFGWPAWEQFRKLSLEQVKNWLDPALRTGPMELTVVGDVDPREVVDLAARYLGTLPMAAAATPEPRRSALPNFPQGQSLRLTIDTRIAKALAVVAYPTADFWDIGRTRRLSILGEIFSERLRVGIRETLGAAYSPFAYNRPYRAYPGYGVFQAHLQIDPQVAEAIVRQVQLIADDLREQGISADEFRRALDPTLTQIKDQRQKNSYWLNSVLVGAMRHPEQLVWARTMEADYSSIRVEEIEALARRYLDNRKAATLVFSPGAAP